MFNVRIKTLLLLRLYTLPATFIQFHLKWNQIVCEYKHRYRYTHARTHVFIYIFFMNFMYFLLFIFFISLFLLNFHLNVWSTGVCMLVCIRQLLCMLVCMSMGVWMCVCLVIMWIFDFQFIFVKSYKLICCASSYIWRHVVVFVVIAFIGIVVVFVVCK